MAWKCIRCEKRIFAPREGSHTFALEWRFSPTKKELALNLIKLHDLDAGAAVTHVQCMEIDGFVDRMKKKLKIPKNVTHPLLV